MKQTAQEKQKNYVKCGEWKITTVTALKIPFK